MTHGSYNVKIHDEVCGYGEITPRIPNLGHCTELSSRLHPGNNPIG